MSIPPAASNAAGCPLPDCEFVSRDERHNDPKTLTRPFPAQPLYPSSCLLLESSSNTGGVHGSRPCQLPESVAVKCWILKRRACENRPPLRQSLAHSPRISFTCRPPLSRHGDRGPGCWRAQVLHPNNHVDGMQQAGLRIWPALILCYHGERAIVGELPTRNGNSSTRLTCHDEPVTLFSFVLLGKFISDELSFIYSRGINGDLHLNSIIFSVTASNGEQNTLIADHPCFTTLHYPQSWAIYDRFTMARP